MFKRTLATAAALTLTLGAATAQAQAKGPNLSGQWEMNAAKSDFGPAAAQAPSKIMLDVEQSDTLFKFTQAMTTPMGDRNVSQVFVFGKEKSQTGPNGASIVSTAKLDAQAVVIDAKMSQGGQEATQVLRWTLAPDGKTMTLDQQIGTPMGAMNMKIVFDKK